ncbi:MAG: hypothetical protein DSY58_04550 [Desulfobulbus sp.]|nr:MAG: hypothetical protein DSY58_04550 [Desulfobulbus sp.]
MEANNVPQQNISTYANNKKAMYATNENGKYTVVSSTGWEVEEIATKQALAELERLAKKAYRQVVAGEFSPLYFHMYERRMDLQTLSQATGFFKWRIRRHLKPAIFSRLPTRLLARYTEALGISAETLCNLPPLEKYGR